VGDSYNTSTFKGSRAVFEHPYPCYVTTPGLFREAGTAIDSMKAEQGLPQEKKVDLLLKNFEFLKVYHKGKPTSTATLHSSPGPTCTANWVGVSSVTDWPSLLVRPR
jgi:hypothetical protein